MRASGVTVDWEMRWGAVVTYSAIPYGMVNEAQDAYVFRLQKGDSPQQAAYHAISEMSYDERERKPTKKG